MADAPDWARLLGLSPHPEGGWYRRTWQAPLTVEPPGYSGPRPTATAIYYLLVPGETSAWHQVRSDELWLFHAGGPLVLEVGGSGAGPGDATREILLGADLAAGELPQALVPAGHWQRAAPRGAAVLVTCVVSPGFDFDDFRLSSSG